MLRNKQQKGFTLLELLIVIAIIGLLASVVMVQFPEAQKRARIAEAQGFAESLRGSLQMDMVAWWPLDETSGSTAKDSWFDQFDGTVVGAVWTEGIINGALSFDGSNDYVRIDDVVVANPSSLTIASWFQKQGEGSNYECVLHQSINTSIGGSSYWMGVDSNDYLTATIGAGTGVGWSAGQTNIRAILGEWIYLVASWDGSVVRVYVNGKYIKQYALTTYSNLDTPTRIGASSDGANYRFNGLIDEVQIYSAALSQSSIQQHYAQGLKTHQTLVKR